MAMSGMSMATSMAMSMATSTAMASMTTSSAMASMASDMSSMSSMDMSSMMPAADMAMVFFTGTATPLYSASWQPTTAGQYAGSCIFLILLSFALRTLYAAKVALEARWLARTMKRRYIVTAEPKSDSEALVGARATLTTRGLSEEVRVLQRSEVPGGGSYMPWRFSVDVPRAALVTVMVGVGYLLMLAVMTMNVGYFLSVLGGAFLGELFFGRFSSRMDDHQH